MLVALTLAAVTGATFYDFKVETIDGKAQPLSEYKGKVALFVNVASKCGLTPQYDGLQKLYDKYKDKGLVILGFPANEFRGQEPGTNAEIKEFCTKEYGVTFPMFSKIVVKGEGIHPLYKWLVANSPKPEEEISWNFEKILAGRKGEVKARFSPRVKPDDPELIKAIEAELGG